MGGKQSARATHFSNETRKPDPRESDDLEPVSQISISSKMVERLVEDALANGSPNSAAEAALTPRERPPRDKDMILSDKLRDLDNSHTEKLGLTFQNVSATTRRIEQRTANMPKKEPVCEECEHKVLECYSKCLSPAEASQCWGLVDEFSRCVQNIASERLHARTLQEEADALRLQGRLAHARQRLPALRPRA